SIEAAATNLERLGFAGKGAATYGDGFEVAGRLEPADLVVVDPPYDFYVDRAADMRGLLETLLSRVLRGPEGRVMAEHRLREGLGDVVGGQVVDERKYGDTVVTFYSRR